MGFNIGLLVIFSGLTYFLVRVMQKGRNLDAKPGEEGGGSEAIGFVIKVRRERKRWTRGELARKIGVTSKDVTNWELAKSAPNDEQIEALAQLFGTTAESLKYEMNM